MTRNMREKEWCERKWKEGRSVTGFCELSGPVCILLSSNFVVVSTLCAFWNECFLSFQTCRCVCVYSDEVGRRAACHISKACWPQVEKRGFPPSAVSIDFFQAVNVPALVMPSCKSGATSPASFVTAKQNISVIIGDVWRCHFVAVLCCRCGVDTWARAGGRDAQSPPAMTRMRSSSPKEAFKQGHGRKLL